MKRIKRKGPKRRNGEARETSAKKVNAADRENCRGPRHKGNPTRSGPIHGSFSVALRDILKICPGTRDNVALRDICQSLTFSVRVDSRVLERN